MASTDTDAMKALCELMADTQLGILVLEDTKERKIVFASHTEEYLGWDAAGLVGKPPPGIITTKSRPDLEKMLEETRTSGGKGEISVEINTSDGEVKTLRMVISFKKIGSSCFIVALFQQNNVISDVRHIATVQERLEAIIEPVVQARKKAVRRTRAWWVAVGTPVLAVATTLVNQLTPVGNVVRELLTSAKLPVAEVSATPELSRKEIIDRLRIIQSNMQDVNPKFIAVALYDRETKLDGLAEVLHYLSDSEPPGISPYFWRNFQVRLIAAKSDRSIQQSVWRTLNRLDCANMGQVGVLNTGEKISEPLYGMVCPTYKITDYGLTFTGALIAASREPIVEADMEPASVILFGSSHLVVPLR